MAKNIIQKVIFRNTTPRALYDLYMNSKKHTASTGVAANISTKEGESFTAHGGYIAGLNLKLVKDQLIVQTWRGSDWKKSDQDSILMLFLEPKGNNVTLHCVHSNLPDKEADGVETGWPTYYWEPWKKYLAAQKH